MKWVSLKLVYTQVENNSSKKLFEKVSTRNDYDYNFLFSPRSAYREVCSIRSHVYLYHIVN